MDTREIVKENLAKLLKLVEGDRAPSGWPRNKNQWAVRAGVSRGTLDRALGLDSSKWPYPQADTLEALARPLGLQAWALLVPNLVAGVEPLVLVTPLEQEQQEKIEALSKQVVATGQAVSREALRSEKTTGTRRGTVGDRKGAKVRPGNRPKKPRPAPQEES